MTAKDALREYIDTEMDEDEAGWMLEWLLRRPLYELQPLTREQRAHIEESLRQACAA